MNNEHTLENFKNWQQRLLKTFFFKKNQSSYLRASVDLCGGLRPRHRAGREEGQLGVVSAALEALDLGEEVVAVALAPAVDEQLATPLGGEGRLDFKKSIGTTVKTVSQGQDEEVIKKLINFFATFRSPDVVFSPTTIATTIAREENGTC